MSIASACAGDVNKTTDHDTLTNDNAGDSLSLSNKNTALNTTKENKLTSSVDDNDKLVDDEEESKVYSLSDLGKLIKYTPNVLVVDSDFMYNASTDGDGLVISKNNYVIDFNGHTIDANKKTGNILKITGNNVVIKNLKFINGRGEYYSTSFWFDHRTFVNYYANAFPILWTGDNGVLDNSEFGQCEVVLNWTGDNGVINNSYFHDSKYEIIYSTGSNFYLGYTHFNQLSGMYSSEYNRGVHHGYHVRINSECKITYCNFTDIFDASLYAEDGDLSYSNFTRVNGYMKSKILSHCIFDSVTRLFDHVYTNQRCFISDYELIEYCTFKNFNYPGYKGAITVCAVDDVLRNCKFINNNVPALLSEALGGVINCTFEGNTIARYTLGYSDVSCYTNAYFDGCTFINNKFNPGYLVSVGGNVRVFNCEFINNTASNTLFYVNTGSTLFIKNSNFTTKNVFNGWAIKLANSNQNLVFLDNLSNFNNPTPINPTTYNNITYMHLYVNQTGGGNGLLPNNATTLTDAINKIGYNGIIEFVNNGEVYNIRCPTINKRINFEGNNITFTYGGTVFDVRADYVVLHNFNFIGCGSSGDTTIRYFRPAREGLAYNFLQIKDCHFINNTGQAAGCIQTHSRDDAWYFGGYNLIVDNCTFINNKATTYINADSWTKSDFNKGGKFSAGAIEIFSGAKIYNSIFENNYAPTGGALSFEYCSAVVENCTFKNNSATTLSEVSRWGQGGFQTAGAVIFHSVNYLESYIKNCTFEDNSAPMAGAIFAQGSGGSYGTVSMGKVSIMDCTFKGNNATSSNGGALYLLSNDANVINCVFIGNNANCGGAIYYDGNKLKIVNSSFNANTGNEDGTIGLIKTTSGNLFISNSNFTGMDCPINLYKFNTVIMGSVFCNNENGTIYGDNSTVTLFINDTSFINNTGRVNGSAIYFAGKIDIEKSVFINNSASAYGGALYLTHNKCNIFNSNFTLNTAVDGGAIFISGDELFVDESYFTYNVATHNNTLGGGGAIFIDGNFAQLYNSIFQYNNATYYGGAIFINGTNRFYSVNSKVYIGFNDTNYCDGPDPRVGTYGYGPGYELEPFNNLKNDKEFNYHNIYEYGAMELIEEVHVVRYPDAIPNNNYTGDRQNPVSFHDALQMVAPNGKIIFINASEIHDEFDEGIPNFGQQLNITRSVNIIGNNTTVPNLRFYMAADNVNVYNMKFTGCSDSVLIFDGSNNRVENCTFIDNLIPGSAEGGYGLGIVVLKENMTIKNTKFINNAIESNNNIGGALYVNASNVEILDCTFENNTGRVSHIYFGEDINTITVNNSVFKDGGKIDDDGVGILMQSMENVKITNCNFTNISGTQGGAIRIDGIFFMLNINGNIFTSNSANNGGASYISIKPGSNRININSNVYVNNTAGLKGGALYMDGAYKGLVISHSNFTGNRAQDGGAIYLTGGSTVSVSNFIANVATNGGGAIYIAGTGSRIMNSNFTYNNATYGSAIYYSPKSQARLYDLLIAENHVFGEDTLGYGDICIDDATFSIPNDDVVFDYYTGTPRYMNYIGNSSSFKLDVVYVTHNGTGLGTSSLTPTTIDKALNLLVKENGTIVFCEDMDVSVTLSNYTNLVLRSNVGQTYTIKRKDGKNVFVITNDSSVTIRNLSLAGGVEVGSNNKLDMIDVTVSITDSESEGIVYNASSSGKIVNSNFTGSKNIDHALCVNGDVSINLTEFSNNNLTGSAVYYSSSGTGSINNSTFYNNTASGDVRNINIPGLNKVSVNNNNIDAVLKNVTISNDVYGYDFTITGYFDAGVNFDISNINVTINDALNTTRIVNIAATTGKFTTSSITGGVLAADKYKLTSNGIQATNIYNVGYDNNNFTVNNVTVAANSAGSVITVTYGMADTIIISGTFNATQRVKYNGNVTLTITNGKYSIENITVVVKEGAFSAVLSDKGTLASGNYNVTVSPNTYSNNQNFTVSEKLFINQVVVNKAIVGANYTDIVASVVYGSNKTITITGTFNQSKYVPNASKYNGYVIVSITGPNGAINTTAQVIDGVFSVVLNDDGRLGAGLYNIVVSNNQSFVNANYTVSDVTFTNKVNVTKAVVCANYTSDVAVVYGMNNTIVIEGTFNASSGDYAVNYNGIVTVTIGNAIYSISNSSVVVSDGKFKAVIVDGGKLAVGIYNITVLSNTQSLNTNYTVSNTTFINKVSVSKAIVSANYTSNVVVVYGMNDTIVIEGTFNASSGDNAIKYNGNVTVTINNNIYSITNSSVIVNDGKFRAVISDSGKLGAGIYNITVLSNAQSLNENYTVTNALFVNKVNITKATVICNVNEIVVVYGVNDTITILGNVTNTTFGVKYNGLVNITIPGTDFIISNVLVSDGEFSTTITDKGNLSAGKYNIVVNSNYINSNYTFTNKTFTDNISVIRYNVTASDLVNVTVVYGVNKTVNISGNVTNAPFGVKYNGLINITITNGVKSVKALNVQVRNGVFNVNVDDMGNLTPGKYNVVVESKYINNYTFVSKTFADNVTVLKYNVSVSIVKINITYGLNTVNIEGNISNSTYGVLYDGFINITVGNHTYNNVVVTGGKFTLTVSDLSDYNVSVNNVSVAKCENDNYILNNITFNEYFIIEMANSSINISSVTKKYDNLVVIPVTGENITALTAEVYTLDGVKVTGINITYSGVNSISIVGLNVGKYIINVTASGDNNHRGSNASANITIIKSASKLVVDNVTVIYSNNNITVWYEVVNATVDSFKVYDESGNPVNCNITKYKYTFEIKGLAAGNYKFNVTADGGVNYENSSSISNITIIKAGSKVVVPVVVITYGEIAVLNVSGENITGIQTVSILNSTGGVVGDYNFTDFTVNVWNLNSSSVHYNVNVTAKVDENHTVSYGIGWVFVKKAGSAINVPDNFNITYGDVKTINIALENVTADNINATYVISNGEIVVCNITRIGTNITIRGLGVGDYAIIVESRETTNYNASVGAGNFKVLKASSSINVPALTNMSHLGGNITISDVVNATGISVKLFDSKGNQIKVKVEGFVIIIDRIEAGEYTLNVTTIVDENHTSVNAVGKLHVEKILAPSSVNITSIQNGIFNTTNPVIRFDVVNKTKISIVVFKNGTNVCVFNSTDFEGDIFTMVNLDPGVYNITITNVEDDYFSSSNATALFEIYKAQSLINIEDIKNGILNTSNATVKFSVTNKTNVYVVVYNASGDVIFESSGFNMNVLSLGGLPLGIYNITIKNIGNDYYFGYNVSDTFKVVVPSSIIASDIGRGYKSPYDYVAVFTDDMGNPLSNMNVTMTVDGKSYNVTTNENGQAYLTQSTLPVGSHEITLYNPSTGDSEIRKVDIVERLQENRDIVMDFADGTYYSVRAFGDDAKPIAGVYVSIKVNGVTYDVKTNEEGYALLKIRLNPNVYKISAEWKDYKINKIVVKQTLSAKSKVVKKSKNLKYSATLKWSNGSPIVGKVITFKFKGKVYKAKTNAKGVAKIKIKKSVLKKLKVGKKYKINITYSAFDGGYTSVNSIYKTIKIK